MKTSTVIVRALTLCIVARACSTAHAWPALEWVKTTPEFGDPAGVEYDADRHVVVHRHMAADGSKQTWEWAGAEWARAADAPMLSAMVWAADRHALTGLDYSAAPPRLWEYNGSAWSVVSTSGPSARGNFVQTYDSINHRLIVLFYAVPPGPGFSSETWTWDGSTWTLVANSGPAQLLSPMLTFDTFRGVAVLLAQPSSGVGTPATWEWSGSAWTLAAPAHSPTTSAVGAFDAARGVTVALSVVNGSYPDHHIQSWEWNGSDWSPGPEGPVDILRPFTAWFDAFRGGIETIDLDWTNEYAQGSEPMRLWQYDGASWSSILHGAPPKRMETAMTYDALRHRVLLGPGETGGGIQFDAWEFDGARWVFQNNQLPELGRRNYAMAFDRARGVAVIQGGFSAPTSSAIEWSGGAWVERMVTGPSGRAEHAMVYDQSRSVCVLFGGWTGSAASINNQTWEWDGVQWTQRPLAGPLPRFGHVMAYDSVRHVTVLFGGRARSPGGQTSDANDTWEYDGVAWTQKSPPVSPSARYYAAMAFDPDRHVVVMHGGRSSAAISGELWEWDGAQWRQPPVLGTAPKPRYYDALAYDEQRHEMMLVGGFANGGATDETWRLRARPCAADLNGDGVVGAADLAQLLGSWGMDSPADLNADGTVTAADLALLLGSWGACP